MADAKADMNKLTLMTNDLMLVGALEKAYSYDVTLVKISKMKEMVTYPPLVGSVPSYLSER